MLIALITILSISLLLCMLFQFITDWADLEPLWIKILQILTYINAIIFAILIAFSKDALTVALCIIGAIYFTYHSFNYMLMFKDLILQEEEEQNQEEREEETNEND